MPYSELMSPVVASFLDFRDSLKNNQNGAPKIQGLEHKNFMYGMRTFSAKFLNTVHGAPYSQNEFHAEIFFFLLE